MSEIVTVNPASGAQLERFVEFDGTPTGAVLVNNLDWTGSQSALAFLRDVGKVRTTTEPGEYDRYNMKRLVSMTANIHGEDLGRVARRVRAALAAASASGGLPRGATVDVRGQVPPMQEMFQGLLVGLGLAVVVILLLLTAYFQSPRLALVSIGAVPGVLSGVVLILFVTRTTLFCGRLGTVIVPIG